MNENNILERLVAVEQSAKSAHKRIDKLEENQEILLEMNTNIQKLAEQTKSQKEDLQNFKVDIKEDINEVKSDIKDLKEKPGKRWDLIVTAIISAVATGLVGSLLAILIK